MTSTMQAHNNELRDMLNEFATFVKNAIINYKYIDTNKDDKNKGMCLAEFILLELYLKKGIKKIKIATDLYILNYCKTHPKYDKNDLLTRLFRHVIIDTNTFSIVNLGIPKSLPINKVDLNDQSIFKTLTFQEYKDGTMIMYNYHLGNDERLAHNPQPENNMYDAKILTRKTIGGGNTFNSQQSFGDMFKSMYPETTLSNMNSDNTSYVFNLYYKDEHITRENGMYLVRQYFYKDPHEQLQTWQNIIKKMQMEPQNGVNDDIDKHFEYMVQGSNIVNAATSPKELTFENVGDMDKYVAGLNGYDGAGVMIYDNYGSRYKIFSPRYIELKELSGQNCRNISMENNQNLFLHWIKLKKEGKVDAFVKEFSSENKDYGTVFFNYEILMQNFIYTAHTWYISYRVKKECSGEEVPYFLRPLIYKLHGIYIANNTPITLDIISHVVSEMNCVALYNRIFNAII